MTAFDATPCTLGEGPLWHPGRATLFWFDILGRRLLARAGDETRTWDFPDLVSAAGWIDEDTLLVASERALLRFEIATGRHEPLAPLEAETPATRSNDGRADPWGGFWIGTMGKRAEPGAGAIHRYFRGEVRTLFPGLTIPNAIAFSPDGSIATFADTRARRIHAVRLGRDGWPEGEPEPFLDLTEEGLNPDGAVFDAAGRFWNAQWGAGRVAAYDRTGRFLDAVPFPARQTSCPAFGGEALATLFCTSAREGLDAAALAADPEAGRTFAAEGHGPGQPEHRVIP